jgi:penicillin-binding protein-related factor A (putative recombinase)
MAASTSIRGRQLELAIERAAVRYAHMGRAWLRRQYAPFMVGRDGYVRPVGDAPVDFIGAIGDAEGWGLQGRSLVIEAKETHSTSFPLSSLRADQRAELAMWHALGAIVLVVIDFTTRGEVYEITWPRVADFIAAPWRRSLTLEWCRAMGLFVPEENRGRAGRRTLFLEAREHWGRAQAEEYVDAEREKSPIIVLDEVPAGDLSTPVVTTPAQLSLYAELSPAEVMKRLRRAAAGETVRQSGGNGGAGRRGKWRGAR